MPTSSDDAQGRGKYRIGTVAQLTGLTADTIRMWERRYGTVAPVRTEGGTRLYGDDEVTRLQLLRALTEAGDPVGAIAQLPTQELRERLARLADLGGLASGTPSPGSDGNGAVRIAVLDAALPEQMRTSPADLGQLELVAAAAEPASLADRVAPGDVDVLVANLALLGPQPLEALQQCRDACGARLVLVLYDWAARRQLARLAAAGARLVRGPIHVSALRQAVLDHLILGAAERLAEPSDPRPPVPRLARGGLPAPARRFDDEQLARLREVRSAIDCECPNHLAGLVASLVAFERYSATCQSRTPEDAALHALLQRGSAEARAALEDLLARVCEQDGIRVPSRSFAAREAG